MRPFSSSLNDAIVHMAVKAWPEGWTGRADLDGMTFADLKETYARTGRIEVWTGGSDETIFASHIVNVAFRAWHDACHLAGDYPFGLVGEKGALDLQLKQLEEEFPGHKDMAYWKRLLTCEVLGQLAYSVTNGHFPDNQRAFTRAFLKSY